MADVLGGAVFRVERSATTYEFLELAAEFGELVEALLNVGEFGVEEFVDVAARCCSVLAEMNDAGDFREGESGSLGVTNELEPLAVRFGVDPVAVRRACWFGQQTAGFVEADGSRRMTGHGGEFSDTHVSDVTP